MEMQSIFGIENETILRTKTKDFISDERIRKLDTFADQFNCGELKRLDLTLDDLQNLDNFYLHKCFLPDVLLRAEGIDTSLIKSDNRVIPGKSKSFLVNGHSSNELAPKYDNNKTSFQTSSPLNGSLSNHEDPSKSFHGDSNRGQRRSYRDRDSSHHRDNIDRSFNKESNYNHRNSRSDHQNRSYTRDSSRPRDGDYQGRDNPRTHNRDSSRPRSQYGDNARDSEVFEQHKPYKLNFSEGSSIPHAKLSPPAQHIHPTISLDKSISNVSLSSSVSEPTGAQYEVIFGDEINENYFVYKRSDQQTLVDIKQKLQQETLVPWSEADGEKKVVLNVNGSLFRGLISQTVRVADTKCVRCVDVGWIIDVKVKDQDFFKIPQSLKQIKPLAFQVYVRSTARILRNSRAVIVENTEKVEANVKCFDLVGEPVPPIALVLDLELNKTIPMIWSDVKGVDGTYWVQVVNVLDICAKWMDKFEEVTEKFSGVPTVGDFCVASYKGVLCRARVVKTDPLTVFYVDFGNVECVSGLKPLPREFYAELPLACKVRFTESVEELEREGTLTMTPICFENDTYTAILSRDLAQSSCAPVAPLTTNCVEKLQKPVVSPATTYEEQPQTPVGPPATSSVVVAEKHNAPTHPPCVDVSRTPVEIVKPVATLASSSHRRYAFGESQISHPAPLELFKSISMQWVYKDKKNPDLNWVQKTNGLAISSQWMTEIENVTKSGSSEDVNVTSLEIGDYCLGYSEEDDGWYRARIMRTNPFEVFFIDFGNVVEINSFSYVKPLPLSLSEVEPLAYQVKFHNPSISDEFEFFDTLKITPLLLLNGVYTVLVGDTAAPNSLYSFANNPINQLPVLDLDKKYQLYFSIYDEIDPAYVWLIADVESMVNWTSIMENYKTFYTERPVIGDFCSGFYEVFCRAKVIEENPLTVFYIDYGNREVLNPNNQLKHLPKELSCHTPRAVRVKFEPKVDKKFVDLEKITVIPLRYDSKNGAYHVRYVQ